MAIAADTSASTAVTGSGGASPASFSYTIGAVSNPILFVALLVDSGATVSAVTWNTSEAMALVGSVSPEANVTYYLYVLANPTTGAHTVSITHTGTPSIFQITASYSGASASGVPDASRVDQQTNNPTTVSLTTIANNCWMVAFMADSNEDAITVNSGGAIRNSIASFSVLVDSNASVGTAGSHSFGIGHVNAVQLSTIIASFAPAGGATDTLWAASLM